MENTGTSCIQFLNKNTALDEEVGLAYSFRYKDLKKATNNFNKVIGEGGYGTVYYGELRDKRVIAVKVINDRSEKSIEQFNNEVNLLSRLRHENLVLFYGSAQEDQKLLLVYEFVPNGTLAYHLHNSRLPLSLSLRIQIAIETAEGLSFLHTSDPQIIHRDVKPDNILLDYAFHVKVADFGLCRFLPYDRKDLFTVTPGTMGYKDPEYEDVFMVTDKSDVYSFGVVLMELILRKKAVDVDRPLDDIYLHKMVLNKDLEQLVDQELGYDNDVAKGVIDSVFALARQCMRPIGDARPPMLEVLAKLKEIKSKMQHLTGFKGTKIVDDECENLYAYKELEKATNSFSQAIGRSGYHILYQGKLRDGRLVTVKTNYIYVKRQPEQWSNEVNILSRYRHENIVTLYGCTPQHEIKRALVYEFVPNGTLADCIHPQEFATNATSEYPLHEGRSYLTWSERIQIAIETAKAITYLHTLEPLIIHCNITSQNILLGNAFHAKLSGFGRSCVLPLGTLQVVTKELGPIGYRDPEYETNLVLSEKSDVYSFGVVLAELITGKQAVDINRDRGDILLSRMVENRILNNKLEKLFDTSLGYKSDIEVKRMIDGVAILVHQCLQPRGKDRPLMVDVLKTLEGIKDGHI